MTDNNTLENIIFGLKQTIAEKNEIIEKQVKIYEKLENSYGELVQENADQKAEIERLTDTLNQYINGELINADTMGKIISLEKQVDELKSENTELYKEHTTLIAGSILEKQNTVKDTAKEICKAIHEDLQATLFNLKHFITDSEGQKAQEQQNIGIIKAQDAVSEFEKTLKKRYGVEVE